MTSGVVGIAKIARDPVPTSPDPCQERADADFAVHQRLVVPLLVGTVGPREFVDCDSGENGGSTIVDTSAGVSHEAAVSQLADRGWQRVDPATVDWVQTGAVAYRTLICGDTVYAVADDPSFGSQAPTGSMTTVEIWTEH